MPGEEVCGTGREKGGPGTGGRPGQCPCCGGNLVIHADGTASCPACGVLIDGDYYGREEE